MPTVNFTPCESDLVEANKLWFRSELWRRGNLLFYLAGAFVFALIASHFASDAGFDPGVPAAALGIVTWVVAVALIQGYYRLRLPRRAREQFAQRKSLHDAVQLSWSEDGIIMEAASGHSRHGWDEFGTWSESAEIFILFFEDRLFTFVPKRVLSTSDIDGLRSRLRQKPRIRGGALPSS